MKPIRPIDLVVSVDEAAEIVGVSPRRIRELLEAGEIDGRQTSKGVWLVSRASAQSFERRPRGPRPGEK